MVRHGAAHEGRARWTPSYRHLVVVILCVFLLVTAGLIAWWWSLITRVDPIDADPVRAAAVVVSSPACADGDTTVVRYVDGGPGGTAELSGCGFAPGKRISVDYLDGSPTTARLAGTSTAGVPQRAKVLLPVGIALCGMAALVAGAMLIVDRGRRRRGTLTVADLQRRLGAEAVDSSPESEPVSDRPSWSTERSAPRSGDAPDDCER